MIHENFVFVGALLNLIGSTNYVYHTIKGKTKPNRVSWFLLALAPMVAFAAMLSEGVTFKESLMTFMVGFGPLLIFIASFVNKKSVWQISRFDIICGVLSLLGLTAWFFTRSGDYAIIFSIMADALAFLPIVRKAWIAPETESPLVFLNGSISAVITLLVVQVWAFASVAFTIYILISCFSVFCLTYFKLGNTYRKLGAA